jgi:hypothetical protein
MDDIVGAFQAELARSSDTRRLEGELGYLVTEFTLSLAAEVSIEGGRPVVRPVAAHAVGHDVAESHVSRLTFQLKPVPVVEPEAKTKPERGER